MMRGNTFERRSRRTNQVTRLVPDALDEGD